MGHQLRRDPHQRHPDLNPWDDLVQEAIDRYDDALDDGTIPSEALGFYYQILNIVCAAAKSQVPECAHMVPYYDWTSMVRRLGPGRLRRLPRSGRWIRGPGDLAGHHPPGCAPLFATLSEHSELVNLPMFLGPFGVMSTLSRAACEALSGDLGGPRRRRSAGGPYDVDEGGTVELDGSRSSDSDDEFVAVGWGREKRLDDPTRKRPTFNAVDDGKVEIDLIVTDDDGATDTASAVIRVCNVDPRLAEIGPFEVAQGSELQLEVSIRDPGDRTPTRSSSSGAMTPAPTRP